MNARTHVRPAGLHFVRTLRAWIILPALVELLMVPPSDAQGTRNAPDVQVLYATNRAVVAKSGTLVFSAVQKDALTYGKAVIAVENSAYAEEPSLDVIYHSARDVRSTPLSHFKTKQIVTLGRSEALKLAAQIGGQATSYPRQTLVFVHGYDTAFDTAVRRAAQIAHDLQYDGPVLVFSWPSAGSVLDYALDQSVARKSSVQLANFLSGDLSSLGFDAVHIVAHSMGNLVLLGALAQVQADHSIDALKLGEVVMAGPDVDRQLFLDTVASISAVRLNYTIYTSRHDQALKVSECVNQTERLGRIAPGAEGINVSPSGFVDLIDVSEGSSSHDQWNHSRVFENPYLLQDVGALLRRRIRPPDVRTPELQMVILEDSPSSFQEYFQFKQPYGTWDLETFSPEPTWIDWLRSATRCTPQTGR